MSATSILEDESNYQTPKLCTLWQSRENLYTYTVLHAENDELNENFRK